MIQFDCCDLFSTTGDGSAYRLRCAALQAVRSGPRISTARVSRVLQGHEHTFQRSHVFKLVEVCHGHVRRILCTFTQVRQ